MSVPLFLSTLKNHIYLGIRVQVSDEVAWEVEAGLTGDCLSLRSSVKHHAQSLLSKSLPFLLFGAPIDFMFFKLISKPLYRRSGIPV
jgi:hypothetical protein